ncbi:Universal stress protein B [Moritella sp. JT01]|uniref:universal stress protein UspB n=1 Tax=Moritella sp. JT01 TaxID=756698 RepID=UPI0007983299|nr:universal stress protein UspB [Moritella sp. JT01]KXO12916.1 Universal stress protein B [Moritella sp. JT01]
MNNSDLIFIAFSIITLVNIARAVSSLRCLLYRMKDIDPLLYQRVNGRIFFSTEGNYSKQMQLFHYIRRDEHLHHFDEYFIYRCNKVKKIFTLATYLVVFNIILIPVLMYLDL